MSKAIAVVEDDESIREMLRYYFQSVGYAVRAYESGEALFADQYLDHRYCRPDEVAALALYLASDISSRSASCPMDENRKVSVLVLI